MEKKSGIIAIFGKTNVGKSTLLNAVIGESVSIVTPKPQTTRNVIRGIFNEERGQIVFLDTPGLHKADKNFGKRMVSLAFEALEGVDAVLWIIDASKEWGHDEEKLKEKLTPFGKNLVIAINKVDKVKDKGSILPVIQEISAIFPDADIYPMSALDAKFVSPLLDILFKKLPVGEALFSEELYTDQMEKHLAAEVVRKHLFIRMRDEIPYASAVYVEEFKEPPHERAKMHIAAVILVEREAHKPMVIGKAGQTIKAIGMSARKELEHIFGCQIDLRLFVKVKPNWSSDPDILKEMGF
jgi:GTPase